MKGLMFMLLMLIGVVCSAQVIEASESEPFPKFGYDEKGIIYFILSSSQESVVFADIVDYHLVLERMKEDVERDDLTSEKINEMQTIISTLDSEIDKLKGIQGFKDEQIIVLEAKIDEMDILIKAHKKEIGRQKRLKIGAYVVASIGIVIAIIK